MNNPQQNADETKKTPGQSDNKPTPQQNQGDGKQGSDKPAQQS